MSGLGEDICDFQTNAAGVDLLFRIVVDFPCVLPRVRPHILCKSGTGVMTRGGGRADKIGYDGQERAHNKHSNHHPNITINIRLLYIRVLI
eukprot:949089-Amorphochlora_amoeboformis.AAC.1